MFPFLSIKYSVIYNVAPKLEKHDEDDIRNSVQEVRES